MLGSTVFVNHYYEYFKQRKKSEKIGDVLRLWCLCNTLLVPDTNEQHVQGIIRNCNVFFHLVVFKFTVSRSTCIVWYKYLSNRR
jgi:hypothetical protein